MKDVDTRLVFDRHLEYCRACQQGPASMCAAGALLARHQLGEANAVQPDLGEGIAELLAKR